jgi:flagellar P-ring protein precursor FlgI
MPAKKLSTFDISRSKKLMPIVLLVAIWFVNFFGVRIKDIAQIDGISSQQLIGYGLVVGLNGSGDSKQSLMANQSLRNMLKHFGITLPSQRMRIKNVAAVMVTSELSAFVQTGSKIDVQVSSMGDASSLEGGVLLLTPLVDSEGQVCAKGQGAISIGGFDISTMGGERLRKNYALVGRVPQGAIVEKKPEFAIAQDTLRLNLYKPDFTTISRMAVQINQNFGENTAMPVNGGQLLLAIPQNFRTTSGKIEFISQLETLEIIPDQFAKIVVNERTGTIVVGSKVTVAEVAVAHGNLSVEISASPIISQPSPFSQGQTVMVPQTQTQVTTEQANLIVMPETVTVQDIASVLNSLGVTPRDLIAIFQALKSAGALHADLVIM